MIMYAKGNLFTSPAKVLVNTVNTVGVMGKGIAKTFKHIYPQMFKEYQTLCERKQFGIGNLWLYKTSHKWVLNFPTKKHWRQPSQPEYVNAGLKKFISVYSDLGITDIAFPRLGCGNGELDWHTVVKPLMKKRLGTLPIDIFVYNFEPGTTVPEHKELQEMENWLRSEPHSLAFSEVWSDLVKIISTGITLKSWDASTQFNVRVIDKPGQGLLIKVISKKMWERIRELLSTFIRLARQPRVMGPGEIYVPSEFMLDLWQVIRSYGFCIPRVLPGALDPMAPYVMSIISQLPYMKPIHLATEEEEANGNGQSGLHLFVPPSVDAKKEFDLEFAVHPA